MNKFDRLWQHGTSLVGSFVMLCFLLLSCASTAPSAMATRLPEDMAKAVSNTLNGTVRLDGSVETHDGGLYLLLLPQGQDGKNAGKKGKAEIDAILPNPKRPDVIMYTNGWAHVRVLHRGEARTLAMSGAVPEKVRKKLLNMHFPSDLIVPQGFVIAKSLKSLIQQVPSVGLIDDEVLISPEFGMKHLATAVSKAAYKGAGSIFLTSITTGSITMLDGRKLIKLAEFPTEGTPCGMELVNGFLYIADEAKNRILLLDPVARKFAGQIDLQPKSAPKDIIANPGGKWLYVSESGANDIAVIDTATNKMLLKTKVHPGPGRLAVTPDGAYVLVLNVTSGELTLLSGSSQAVMGTVRVGDMPISIAISPDSKYAYVANRFSNNVSVVDLGLKRVIGSIKCGQSPTAVLVGAGGSKLYVSTGRDNTVTEYDCKTLAKLRELKFPSEMEFPGALCPLPDGHHFIVISQGADALSVIDAEKFEASMPIALGHANHQAVWEPVP
jgi:YVTN family beta-propeller protein